MERSDALAQQMRGNFGDVEASPEFSGDRMWLTVYLTGDPTELARLVPELAALGWANLTDWEGGFVYPKLEVAKSADEAVEAITAFSRIIEAHRAEILHVDADTSSDVFASHFVRMLFRT